MYTIKLPAPGKAIKQSQQHILFWQSREKNILLRDTSNSNGHAAAAASVGAVTFFESLGSEFGEYDLDKKISAQEAAAKKAERDLSALEKNDNRLKRN